MNEWRFGDLKPLSYNAVLVDPAWLFKLRSHKGERKAPQRHYSCMEIEDIIDLPVITLAQKNCLLWLWATWPMLPQAMRVLDEWGFSYVTGGVWAKQSTTGSKWHFGTGYVMRSASEPFLIGKIGRPRLFNRSQRNLIVAPIREHSRKPDSQYEMIEKMIEPPYCELFSRSERPGWSAWGDEAGKFKSAA